MEASVKPIPMPRKSLNSKFENSNEELNNVNLSSPRPIPLPRKQLQRLTPSLASLPMNVISNEDVTNHNEELSVSNDKLFESVGAELNKRGTINIFKRSSGTNPFDNDFEKSLEDGHIHKVDFPPKSKEKFESRQTNFDKSRFSCSSEEYYSDPNPEAKPVLFPKTSTRRSIASEKDVPGLNIYKTVNVKNEVGGSKGKSKYGRRAVSSFPVISHDMENGNDESRKENDSGSGTETSESIYEPISSYSSSSSSVSGSGGDPFVFQSQQPPRKPNAHSTAGKRATMSSVEDSRTNYIKASPAFRLGTVQGAVRANSIGSYDPHYDTVLGIPQCILPGKLTKSSNKKLSDSSDHHGGNLEGVVLRRKVEPPTHEYDEVAIEDGIVVFPERDTYKLAQLDSVTTNDSSSSLTSRNSIIIEFDPLLEPETLNHIEPVKSSGENPDPGSRYEYIDEEDEAGQAVKLNRFSGDFSPRPTIDIKLQPEFGNPTYFENNRDSVKSHKSSPGKRSTNMNTYHLEPPGEEDEDGHSESDDNEYESVELATFELEPPRCASPSTFSTVSTPPQSSSPCPSTTSNLSNLSQGKEGSGNFFRKLSQKIRLIPIKEELSAAGSFSSLVSAVKRNSSYHIDKLHTCSICSFEHSESSKCKFTPTANPSVIFSTYLYKPSGLSKKDFTKRRAVFNNGKIVFYNDKSNPIDEIELERVLQISKKEGRRGSASGQDLKFFQFILSGGSKSIILGTSSNDERNTWMMKYIEAFTPFLDLKFLSSYDRAGWCFIKESVTGDWTPSWIVLNERFLYFSFVGRRHLPHAELDLRKARSVILNQKDGGDYKCPYVDNSTVLTIDIISKIFFLQTDSSKLTSNWENNIKTAALHNGPTFEEKQLTLDNVPVIVDKCIDFLYANGTLAEGIYRHSGSNARITQLLADFQKDGWSVQISQKEFSAHDVAGTLKRFFRTLPEPLFTERLYDDWLNASNLRSFESKHKEYIRLLDALPPINFNILKKLICHLYAVHELHEKNLMPLINLAPIWGPTLMNVDSSKSTQSFKNACLETEVVKELIENYYTLFRVDPKEIAREKKMQDALENFHLGCTKRKRSGDMRIWIYIGKKDETSAVNITLTPISTAHLIVQQLNEKNQCENLSLFEVIGQNDQRQDVERPLHPSEKVIETVLRWSVWDADERKDNYLIFKTNHLYPLLHPYAKEPTTLYSEFKYADSKSKNFKKYPFEFSKAILKQYKDSKASQELGSWKIEDLVWYLGCESKRNPPTKWAFTFMKRNEAFKRTKEEPFLGNVVSCNSEEELYKWLGTLVLADHPEGIYPSVIV